MTIQSVTIWYLKGEGFSETFRPHWPSTFNCFIKKLEEERSVLSGNVFANVLETKCIVNGSTVK